MIYQNHSRTVILYISALLGLSDYLSSRVEKMSRCSPRILWKVASTRSLRQTRALRSTGTMALVLVSLNEPLFWPELLMYQREEKSQPDSAAAFSSVHSFA